MKRTALVTGGSGFFGGILKRTLLAQGWKVLNIDLVKDEDTHPNLLSIQGDIRDRKTLEQAWIAFNQKNSSEDAGLSLSRAKRGMGPAAEDTAEGKGGSVGGTPLGGPSTTIFHCAAILAHAVKDKNFLWSSNVDGTRSIVEFAKAHQIPKIIFTSSNCLWGENFGRPIREDDQPNPVEIYGKSFWKNAFMTFAPCGLLVLWSLSNPLAIATMAIHGNDGAKTSLNEHLLGTLGLWIVGGAGIVSAVGTWGILRSKDWPLIATLVLVFAYVTASVPYAFYAILFTPLFVAGLHSIFAGRRHPHAFPLLACFVFATAIITWFIRLPETADPSRSVMAAIAAEPVPPDVENGSVLISGTFGHQWQYESQLKVRRYKSEFAKDARAVVCLAACAPMFDTSSWKRLPDLEMETWVRK